MYWKFLTMQENQSQGFEAFFCSMLHKVEINMQPSKRVTCMQFIQATNMLINTEELEPNDQMPKP